MKIRRRLVNSLGLITRDHRNLFSLIGILSSTIIIFNVFLLTRNDTSNNCTQRSNESELKYSVRTIYVVTPTYYRYVQKAELTRLANTLLLVPHIHWIIVEDSQHKTKPISLFIDRLKSRYNFVNVTHLNRSTPLEFKIRPNEPDWAKPKGVWQRNEALKWLRTNSFALDQNGLVYFADDDNTYDLELFDEIRKTKVISVWPVAFCGGLLVERPLVDPKNTSRVKSFNSRWKRSRPYPIDMSGFAISVKLLFKNPKALFSSQQPIGYLESNFISQLIDSKNELEPRADECRRILVWHTKTKQPSLHEEKKLDVPSTTGLQW